MMGDLYFLMYIKILMDAFNETILIKHKFYTDIIISYITCVY